MTENEKQILEQVAAISMATADMTCRLVFRLVNLKKLSPDEALLVLGDLSGHQRDLAIRNEKIPGSASIYHQIADRIDVFSDTLQRDTGAKMPPVPRKPS